jgi:hypothetical protein
MVFRMKLLLPLGAALFLGACVQSISTSAVFIDDTYLTDKFRNELIGEVYEKTEQFGGECELRNIQRQYHSCLLNIPSNPSLRLSVGYNPKGNYRIAVISTFGHWLPQSDQNITSGKFIGSTQKELEVWMRSLIPHDAIIRAERTYLDHETVQTF